MSADKEQKLKIIDDAISSIEKTYGKGSIMKLGDGIVQEIESIPTGALSLDYALGIGGIPRGRVTEIYVEDFRIHGWLVKVRRKYARKLKEKEILIRHPDIFHIENVIFINERAYEKIMNEQD